jgi:apolipoprotein N-acyltransferase
VVSRLQGYALPVLSGILLALSFPKTSYWALAWVSLVPLIVSVSGRDGATSFKYGLAAGMVFYLSSIYWIVGTMTGYGGLPYPLSILLLVALSCYLALYTGLFAWLVTFTGRLGTVTALAAAPFFWCALELARNYMLSGFPWNLLGYSQSPQITVIQIADSTGVYGISALIVLVNAALAGIVLAISRKGVAWKKAAVLALAAVLVTASAVGYGHYRLSHPPDKSGTIKVALVQGNIEQFAKWDPAYQDEVIDIYSKLTMAASASHPDIIIWPETATPFYYQDDELRRKVEALAKNAGAYLLTGSPSYKVNKDGTFTDYNSAYLITPGGITVGRYNKIHLVPFGEYVPLKKLLPFVSKMVTSIGDFGTGTKYTVLNAGKGSFGTAICFEAIFPELVRMFPLGGADFLVNITNDAWFGKSAAPYQHFDMALMRAVENRRTLVRAANTGISGIVNPEGEVTAKTDIFTRGYIVRDVGLVKDKSFYTLHGDLFAFACVGISLVFIVLILVRRGYNIKKKHR